MTQAKRLGSLAGPRAAEGREGNQQDRSQSWRVAQQQSSCLTSSRSGVRFPPRQPSSARRSQETHRCRRSSMEQSPALRTRWVGVRTPGASRPEKPSRVAATAVPPAVPDIARIAQLAERRGATAKAAGSKPAARSIPASVAKPARRETANPGLWVRVPPEAPRIARSLKRRVGL